MLKVKDKYDYRRELCDALRSGKYTQVIGEHSILMKNNSACVLGVAVHIFNIDMTNVFHYEECYRKIEITSIEGEKLWRGNDTGASFEELAKYIETLP